MPLSGDLDLPGVPVRMYVDHQKDDFPDAILLSEATIAFARGIQELSFLLDPSQAVEIGLFPSELGSFWQNAYLKAQEEYQRRVHLYQLAAAAMIWFVQPPLERMRANAWAPYLDKYLPEIKPEDKAAAQANAERVTSAGVAEKERQTAFKAFSQDKAVRGVGVNVERAKPSLIVPRKQFLVYAGATTEEVLSDERVTTSFEQVILISPVLEVGTRRWKLKTSKGEIGASIKDVDFLERAVSGRLAVPLSGGIRMDVKLETREKSLAGLWRPTEYHVIEVLNVEAPPAQGGLFTEDRT